MNNINVKYINMPEEIKEQMNEEFCMGWNEVEQGEDTEVRFVGFISDPCVDWELGFELIVFGKKVYFDYFTTCYSLTK